MDPCRTCKSKLSCRKKCSIKIYEEVRDALDRRDLSRLGTEITKARFMGKEKMQLD